MKRAAARQTVPPIQTGFTMSSSVIEALEHASNVQYESMNLQQHSSPTTITATSHVKRERRNPILMAISQYFLLCSYKTYYR